MTTPSFPGPRPPPQGHTLCLESTKSRSSPHPVFGPPTNRASWRGVFFPLLSEIYLKDCDFILSQARSNRGPKSPGQKVASEHSFGSCEKMTEFRSCAYSVLNESQFPSTLPWLSDISCSSSGSQSLPSLSCSWVPTAGGQLS